MTDRIERSGLQVDGKLAGFVEQQVLAPLGLDSGTFWSGFAALLERLVPVNRSLLAKRDALQAKIDEWHLARAGKPLDTAEYRAFLAEIGYLVPEPAPFTRCDAECRCRDRDDGRAAAGRADAQCAFPAQRRQRPLGQPL